MRKFAIFAVPLALALLAATPARADLGKYGWCKADRSPQIQVKTSTDQVKWDYSKSEKDLNAFNIDTINPYGNSIITDVGGLMQGGIELSEKISFRTITHNRMAQMCYWYDTVQVSLHILPTIYIAREFPPGTCKHNAIREHELKHIEVDREIVNKYAALIGAAVKQELDKQSLFGPYHTNQSKEVEAYLSGRIAAVIKYHHDMMSDERKRRQQVIDSLNEYERVNHLCDRR